MPDFAPISATRSGRTVTLEQKPDGYWYVFVHDGNAMAAWTAFSGQSEELARKRAREELLAGPVRREPPSSSHDAPA